MQSAAGGTTTDKVTLTINGTAIQADTGATILKAAQDAHIYIPHLCAHPDLFPSQTVKTDEVVYRGQTAYRNDHSAAQVEGCQLCLVQINGQDSLVTSCSTPVTEGMVVNTDSPDIKKQRRANLTTILATHPHYCTTCPSHEGCSPMDAICSMGQGTDTRCCSKLNHCEVQAVSEYICIDPNTPRYVFRNLPRVTEEPLFNRDYNLCINCARCIRVCRDVQGTDALAVVFQNGKALVGTRGPTLKESGCKFCGACVEVCPTGTLLDKGIKPAEQRARLRISAPDLPPLKGLTFSAEMLVSVPEKSGVYRLINDKGEIIAIKGVMNLRAELQKQLAGNSGKACFFDYEETFRYTARESELLQKFMQEHGKMPDGNQELDDLF